MRENAMYEKILFVDFDGTVTSEETLEGILRRFTDPGEYAKGEAEFRAGRIGLPELLTYAFSTIPYSRMEDIMEYVRGVELRPGFDAFLDTAGAMGIPVVIISGGLRSYVEEILEPYREKILDVYSIDSDCVDGYIRLLPEYRSDRELMNKTAVMKRYDFGQSICIGDGYTDIIMAMAADTVFARDVLAEHLAKAKKPFYRWGDFFDVEKVLKEL